MSQEQSTQLSPALLSCLVEWGEAPLVCGVHNGRVLDQKGRNVKMAIRAGVVKRNEASLVLGVHIRTLQYQDEYEFFTPATLDLLQEVVGHFKIVVSCSKMKRGRVPAGAVSAVYIFLQQHHSSPSSQANEAHLSKELLNPAKVALLRGVQQGRVASEEINDVLISLLNLGILAVTLLLLVILNWE